VTLLGGASQYDNHDNWWQTAYTLSVGGKIKNRYSDGDIILHLYRVSQMHLPIGRAPIWHKDKANVRSKEYKEAKENAVAPALTPVFNWQNYEMEKGLGHMEYREKLIEIAHRIKLEL
jgi:hypothetical protein